MIKKPNWQDFDHIDVWIFDLDNTLYPSHCDLFVQMDKKMGEFVSQYLQVEYDEAKKIQKEYFSEYGTTLNGLMHRHGMDAAAYLEYVHDLEIDHIEQDIKLNEALDQLDGRKVIFTNASDAHARNISKQIGIDHHFDDIFDIHQSDFIPKPEMSVYKKFLEEFDIDPTKSVFFEDMAKNLKPAHDLGMKTVWIPNKAHWSHEQSEGEHIHYVADDLSQWLTDLVSDKPAKS
ncbi:pyrimidine 5'-nucleotidase [Sneathiella sp. P13V-1]|uniref:pyrimidine 5'-nucleotidase n=1 Tax=Sneathiella sp. P13V-1 TaxID=2697366 RepID=UPI00187B7EFA|nr:pyrimidine 5'-nucleotidase [Sneathiella sp. P13V-1]MBE7635421.1 pyrimidine 5'-nucleotidase [Sneathiella sp. P13V-1]